MLGPGRNHLRLFLANGDRVDGKGDSEMKFPRHPPPEAVKPPPPSVSTVWFQDRAGRGVVVCAARWCLWIGRRKWRRQNHVDQTYPRPVEGGVKCTVRDVWPGPRRLIPVGVLGRIGYLSEQTGFARLDAVDGLSVTRARSTRIGTQRMPKRCGRNSASIPRSGSKLFPRVKWQRRDCSPRRRIGPICFCWTNPAPASIQCGAICGHSSRR